MSELGVDITHCGDCVDCLALLLRALRPETNDWDRQLLAQLTECRVNRDRDGITRVLTCISIKAMGWQVAKEFAADLLDILQN